MLTKKKHGGFRVGGITDKSVTHEERVKRGRKKLADLQPPSEADLKKYLLYYLGGPQRFCKDYVAALRAGNKELLSGFNNIAKLLLKGDSKDIDASAAEQMDDAALKQIIKRTARE